VGEEKPRAGLIALAAFVDILHHKYALVIMDPVTRTRLVTLARTAAQGAYCRYSRYRVGAAVLAGGKFYTGCNIENASYGLTVCAERVAIFNAISDGQRKLDALAVACPDASSGASTGSKMPCGACRQVLAEFGTPDMLIIVDGIGDFRVADLLPDAFHL
jgi:cytidine deaminase